MSKSLSQENILFLNPDTLRALVESKTPRNEMAKLCGVHKATIFQRLKEYGITKMKSKKYFCDKCSKKIQRKEMPWCSSCRAKLLKDIPAEVQVKGRL